ncbi:MAG: sigma-54-dependent Fis family transcriptional regulator [Nitrospirae bacterium]|nr:sigma-54-dependent Fis family transcriptional regulator [Nitrospirota bacterium]
MMKERVLVVDDTKDMVSFLKRLISSELGVEVVGVFRASDAVETVSGGSVDVVIADVKMPEKDGVTLLRELKTIDEDIVVILLTGYGTVDMAVESLKLGAYDFLTKPIDNDRLLHTVKKALQFRMVLKEKTRLEETIKHSGLSRELIGESRVMEELMENIKTVAGTDETVLITGETGTGKELAARTIHRMSKRARGPFIAVNCPAIPESILESELFGYKKGAFTSAVSDKKGLFEVSNGGTIFLDEVADIPVSVQTKLLRVLQEKEFKPLGDTSSVKVDVRVLASTNQDIEGKVEKGLFRDDLYYRLNVITIRMPSLSERIDDIPLLSRHFLRRYAIEFGKEIRDFTEDAMAYLTAREWRGNVRELQNVIKRAVIFSRGPEIDSSCFQGPSRISPCKDIVLNDILSLDYRMARNKVLERFTVSFVRNLLQKTDGNVTRAARMAGMERQSLQHLMRKYGINPQDYRKEPAR